MDLTNVGDYKITVKVTDDHPSPKTASYSFTIKVIAESLLTPNITVPTEASSYLKMTNSDF